MKRIIILLVFSLLIISVLPASDIDYIEALKSNIFINAFTEPFEVIYIICYNGDIYRFSTHDEEIINIRIDIIVESLRVDGKKASDIAMFIHNHWAMPRFSQGDISVHNYLISKGFKGAFLLWIVPQKLLLQRLENGEVVVVKSCIK